MVNNHRIFGNDHRITWSEMKLSMHISRKKANLKNYLIEVFVEKDQEKKRKNSSQFLILEKYQI
jgi:hypothetical protein